MPAPRIAYQRPKIDAWTAWRRHAIGGLAAVLLAGAVWFWFVPPTGTDGMNLESACWRMGALAGAIWLAYGQLQRIPVWLWGSLPVLLIVLWKRPQWIVLAIPLAIVIAILKPRKAPAGASRKRARPE